VVEASYPRPWVARIRRRLAPFGRMLTLAFLLVLLGCELNAYLGWDLFGLNGKKSHGVALAVGLLWFIFVSPQFRNSPGELGSTPIAEDKKTSREIPSRQH
jgi:hypothetical protein